MMSRFHLKDSKTHITPLDPNIQLIKDQCSSTDDKKAAMSKIPYREAIGSLMWAAVATQPDIIAISISRKSWRNTLEGC